MHKIDVISDERDRISYAVLTIAMKFCLLPKVVFFLDFRPYHD
jgi:hypothetical protein